MPANIDAVQFVVYFFVTFLTSILSGIAGGGGGFINTPLLIFFGLSPAQAVATGKLPGLSVSIASLGSMRNTRIKSRKELVAIIALALVIGLIAPILITNLDSELYRRLLAVILLIMIPVLIIKRVGHTEKHVTSVKKILGYVLLVPALCLQAVFSAGMGNLVNAVLMSYLGMSALEASITKRYSQVVLNVVIVLGVLFSSLIVWPLALIGILSSAIGGYIGGRMAVKQGDIFVMRIFIVLMFISAIGLLIG